MGWPPPATTTGDSTCPVERAWTYERHLGTAQMNPAHELRHVMDAYDAAQVCPEGDCAEVVEMRFRAGDSPRHGPGAAPAQPQCSPN